MEKSIHVLSRAVILKNQKLLVCVNQKSGFLFLPGGHVEHGESAAKALGRELEEELGFLCSVGRFLGCFEYSFVLTNPDKCHSHEYNFLFLADAHQLDSDSVPESSEDHTVFAWIELAELDGVDFRPQSLKKPLIEWFQVNYADALASSIESGKE